MTTSAAVDMDAEAQQQQAQQQQQPAQNGDTAGTHAAPRVKQDARQSLLQLKRKFAEISCMIEGTAHEARGLVAWKLAQQSTKHIKLSAEDRQQLEESHKRRLADITTRQALQAVKAAMAHKWAWPFNQPVDIDKYKDYLVVVGKPMDFGTIKNKCESGQYSTPDQLLADARLVFENARKYNPPGTDVFVMAQTVQDKFIERWRAQVDPKIKEEQNTLAAAEAALKQQLSAAVMEKQSQAMDPHVLQVLGALQDIQNRISEAKSVAAMLCSALSSAEVEALAGRLRRLSVAQLEPIISLLEHHSPGLSMEKSDFDLDLHSYDALLLRQLEYYATACDSAGLLEPAEVGTEAGSAEDVTRIIPWGPTTMDGVARCPVKFPNVAIGAGLKGRPRADLQLQDPPPLEPKPASEPPLRPIQSQASAAVKAAAGSPLAPSSPLMDVPMAVSPAGACTTPAMAVQHIPISGSTVSLIPPSLSIRTHRSLPIPTNVNGPVAGQGGGSNPNSPYHPNRKGGSSTTASGALTHPAPTATPSGAPHAVHPVRNPMTFPGLRTTSGQLAALAAGLNAGAAGLNVGSVGQDAATRPTGAAPIVELAGRGASTALVEVTGRTAIPIVSTAGAPRSHDAAPAGTHDCPITTSTRPALPTSAPFQIPTSLSFPSSLPHPNPPMSITTLSSSLSLPIASHPLPFLPTTTPSILPLPSTTTATLLPSSSAPVSSPSLTAPLGMINSSPAQGSLVAKATAMAQAMRGVRGPSFSIPAMSAALGNVSTPTRALHLGQVPVSAAPPAINIITSSSPPTTSTTTATTTYMTNVLPAVSMMGTTLTVPQGQDGVCGMPGREGAVVVLSTSQPPTSKPGLPQFQFLTTQNAQHIPTSAVPMIVRPSNEHAAASSQFPLLTTQNGQHISVLNLSGPLSPLDSTTGKPTTAHILPIFASPQTAAALQLPIAPPTSQSGDTFAQAQPPPATPTIAHAGIPSKQHALKAAVSQPVSTLHSHSSLMPMFPINVTPPPSLSQPLTSAAPTTFATPLRPADSALQPATAAQSGPVLAHPPSVMSVLNLQQVPSHSPQLPSSQPTAVSVLNLQHTRSPSPQLPSSQPTAVSVLNLQQALSPSPSPQLPSSQPSTVTVTTSTASTVLPMWHSTAQLPTGITLAVLPAAGGTAQATLVAPSQIQANSSQPLPATLQLVGHAGGRPIQVVPMQSLSPQQQRVQQFNLQALSQHLMQQVGGHQVIAVHPIQAGQAGHSAGQAVLQLASGTAMLQLPTILPASSHLLQPQKSSPVSQAASVTPHLLAPAVHHTLKQSVVSLPATIHSTIPPTSMIQSAALPPTSMIQSASIPPTSMIQSASMPPTSMIQSAAMLPTSIVQSAALPPTSMIQSASIPPTSMMQSAAIPPTSMIQSASIPPTSMIQSASIPPTSMIQSAAIPPTSMIQSASMPPTSMIQSASMLPTSMIQSAAIPPTSTILISTSIPASTSILAGRSTPLTFANTLAAVGDPEKTIDSSVSKVQIGALGAKTPGIITSSSTAALTPATLQNTGTTLRPPTVIFPSSSIPSTSLPSRLGSMSSIAAFANAMLPGHPSLPLNLAAAAKSMVSSLATTVLPGLGTGTTNQAYGHPTATVITPASSLPDHAPPTATVITPASSLPDHAPSTAAGIASASSLPDHAPPIATVITPASSLADHTPSTATVITPASSLPDQAPAASLPSALPSAALSGADAGPAVLGSAAVPAAAASIINTATIATPHAPIPPTSMIADVDVGEKPLAGVSNAVSCVGEKPLQGVSSGVSCVGDLPAAICSATHGGEAMTATTMAAAAAALTAGAHSPAAAGECAPVVSAGTDSLGVGLSATQVVAAAGSTAVVEVVPADQDDGGTVVTE